LVAQPELMSHLALTINEDLKNRVTYSVLMQKMAPDTLADFIRGELDKVALAHTTFTDDALGLIIRSSEGVLRRAKNLCIGTLLEAVRDRPKSSTSSRSTVSCANPIGDGTLTSRSSRHEASSRLNLCHGRSSRQKRPAPS
jgi:hypothetical protein